MTDENSADFQSASSSEIHDETNSPFILNQSNVPMDIDNNNENIKSATTNHDRQSSPSSYAIENENNHEQMSESAFRPGNTALNKSYDIIPQINDDASSEPQPVSENDITNTNILDTAVELLTLNNENDGKPSLNFNDVTSINDIETPTSSTPGPLTNQFSLEHPYVIPQPAENIQPSSPRSIEKVTSSSKTMNSNINKTSEEQEHPKLTHNNDKAYDTNTFVLKRKDRRKAPAMSTDSSFNGVTDDVLPDACAKQSPFNTPSASFDITVPSRAATATTFSQKPPVDPTRIM